MPNRTWLTPDQIVPYSLDRRQFMDFRESTLPNGIRIIDAYNGSGLHFTVLPDRGLDIWTAHFKGLPLTWVSPGSPFPPDTAQGWLRQFNGGLLTTCGLQHVGPPEVDNETGENRGIHGRYTFHRATNVTIQEDGPGAIQLTGRVEQSTLFGEQLRLERTYRLELGQPSLSITDRITNLGDVASPLMLLYHINAGYPLVQKGTHLHTASKVYARDDDAREGLEHWSIYDGPTPSYREQVFFHHVYASADNLSKAALLNDSFGLLLEWDTSTLPYFTQWKNVRQGIYVCGIEPSNCVPTGLNHAREMDRLVTLKPGQTIDYALKLTALDRATGIQAVAEEIESLGSAGTLVPDCRLADYDI